MFGYLFYRLYHHYEKFKGYNDYGFHASVFLSAIQIAFIVCILLLINTCFRLTIPQNLYRIITVVGVAVFISFSVINYKRFNDRIHVLDKKYACNKANVWFKDWMLFGLIILLVLLPFVVSHFVFHCPFGKLVRII